MNPIVYRSDEVNNQLIQELNPDMILLGPGPVSYTHLDPQKQLYALHGSAVHTITERHTSGNMLSEERLKNNTTTGQFDLYGQVLSNTDTTLGDLKITSSYKLMKALGYYKQDVETGEVYKTGVKKGQPKTRKELFTDGVRHVLDWALQLNYYRLLLEEENYTVSSMAVSYTHLDVYKRQEQ